MITGKLKRTLSEKCPVCGKVLQVRAIPEKIMSDGEIITIEKDTIFCSDKLCEYEKDIKEKRRRRFQGI